VLTGHDGQVSAVAVSADGRTVVSDSDSGVLVLDLAGGTAAVLTVGQCLTNRASRLTFSPVLGGSTAAFVAYGSQEPLGASARAAERLAGMGTDDATSVYQGALALYRALTCTYSVDEGVRAGRIAAISRNLNTRPWATYQDMRFAGVGGVGSAAWLWKLAAVPGDLDMLLARYGELDECAPADATMRLWKLATGHGGLEGVLAGHLGHVGQDAPVDAAGACLLCVAQGGEGDISGEQGRGS